jgi:MioC protein
MNILITYASMTGTAEFVSEEIHDQLESMGLNPTLLDMSDLDLDKLKTFEKVIICSSSYGAGDVPSNGSKFYKALNEFQGELSHIDFAVCGIGDGSYVHTFCGAAKKFQEALLKAKANECNSALFHDCRKDDEPEVKAVEWVTEIFVGCPT